MFQSILFLHRASKAKGTNKEVYTVKQMLSIQTGLSLRWMFSRWRPPWCLCSPCVCATIYEVTFSFRWLTFDDLVNIQDHREPDKLIVSPFPIPVLHVMARLFKNCGKHWTAVVYLFCAGGFLPHDVWSYCSEAAIPFLPLILSFP